MAAGFFQGTKLGVSDLLQKYDYKEPPKTWEELGLIAKRTDTGGQVITVVGYNA